MKEADVVYMTFGSHLYGLDTPMSDKDYKGVCLPDTKSLLLDVYYLNMEERNSDS